MPTEQTNIKVIVRVRPYNRRELEQNQRCIIKVMDNTTLLFDPDEEDDEFFFQGVKQNYRDMTKRVNKKLSMEYDRVFDADAQNMQIFEECTAPLVDSVLNGYNCSVFVYGATGAGKTFTMLGNEHCRGLTFLTMRDLFNKMKAQSDKHKFDIGVSYLEVYNEQVMNLLTKTGPMKLREDTNGVLVSGLVLKPIFNADELLDLLALGNNNRTQHPTDANAESSRSHAVFQVHIRITDRKTGTKRTVKLSMIDLAGSERAASTKGLGARFKEGASINKSLLALGNCINKLADGMKHIPYRDSNLTRLLKDSLGGNCQTLMVANISMSSLTYDDTYNTLKYASRAKKIRTTLRQNALKSNMPKDFFVRKVNELTAENERLKETNKALEAKIALLENTSATRAYDDQELKPWYNKIDAIYAALMKTEEQAMGLQSKIKNFNFCTKLKEEAETYKKILNTNKTDLQEDYDVFDATLTRVGKQIEKEKLELTRWRIKVQSAYRELEKLKKEIKECKYADILQVYGHGKDLEVQLLKRNMNLEHISAINTEFIASSYKLHQALKVACELLQHCKQTLESEQKFTPQMEIDFDRLLHNVNFKSVTCKDSDEPATNGGQLDYADIENLLNGKRQHAGNETSALKRARYKRLNFVDANEMLLDTMYDCGGIVGDSNETSNVFKMPNTAGKPNEMQNFNSDDDYNTTFDSSDTSLASNACSTSKKQQKTQALQPLNKKQLVTSILSEQLVHAPAKKEQLQHVLLNSKTFNHRKLLKTVTTGVQKENKKNSPNRVRKSPRNVVSKAFANTAKQALRLHGDTTAATAPSVRFNRAASFRIKK